VRLRASGGSRGTPESRQHRAKDRALLDTEAIIRGVQGQVYPYDKNLFRTRAGLAASRQVLDGYWKALEARPAQLAREVVRAREAAAMVATARWMYATAEQRTETRGMHKHQDFPSLDPTQQRRLHTGGLEQIWVRPDPQQSQPTVASRSMRQS